MKKRIFGKLVRELTSVKFWTLLFFTSGIITKKIPLDVGIFGILGVLGIRELSDIVDILKKSRSEDESDKHTVVM